MSINTTMSAIEYDRGLRSYMMSIYNWMILGLLVSAGSAYFAELTGITAMLSHGGIWFWVVVLLPFMAIAAMAGGMAGEESLLLMTTAYIVLTAFEGFSLSVMLVRFTGTNIVMSFLLTGIAFAGLSLWSLVTRINLSQLGNFFFISLLGLIVAMVAAIWLHSSVLNFIISVVGLIIFAGLVAYDTQTMRANYIPGDSAANRRMAIWSALDLYLDFLNIFLFILRLMGSSNDD